MASFTRFIDRATRVHERLRIFRVDGRERLQAGILQIVRELNEAGVSGSDALLDFSVAQLTQSWPRTARRVGGNDTPRHAQEVGCLNERQCTRADRLPLFVGARPSVFYARCGGYVRHRIPKGIGGRVDNAVHQFLNCRGQAVGRCHG